MTVTPWTCCVFFRRFFVCPGLKKISPLITSHIYRLPLSLAARAADELYFAEIHLTRPQPPPYFGPLSAWPTEYECMPVWMCGYVYNAHIYIPSLCILTYVCNLGKNSAAILLFNKHEWRREIRSVNVLIQSQSLPPKWVDGLGPLLGEGAL